MARRKGRGRNAGQKLRQRQAAQQRFIAPPTPRGARKIAGKEAGLEFNPVIRQMRSEARGSQGREKQISDWYSQLGTTYAQGQQQAADAFKSAEDATNKRLAEAGQRGDAAVQSLSAEDAKFADLVGGPQDAAGTAQRASAQQAAGRQAATLTAPLAAQGADYVASLGTRRTAAALRGIEAHKEEGERRGKITQDLAKARRERGAATGVNLEKLREGARDYAVQQQAFGQKKREANVSAVQGAQKIRQSAQKGRREAEQLAIEKQKTPVEIAADKALAGERQRGNRNSKNGLTPSEQREAREGRRNAISEAQALYRAYKAAGKPPKTAAEWANFQLLVAEKAEVSPADAQWAVKRLHQRAKQNQPKPAAPRTPGFNP